MVEALLNNMVAILGAGFLGLSAIFVTLAYMNVQQITSQSDPNPLQIELSKSFMRIALIFMIAAGPLQWATVLIKELTDEDKVTLFISMTHPQWEESFGEVIVVKRGEKFSITNQPYQDEFSHEDEIQINAGSVLQAIQTIRAQLTAATNVNRSQIGRDVTPDTPKSRAVLDGG